MIKPRLAAIDIKFTSPPTHPTAGAVLLKGEGRSQTKILHDSEN